MHGEPFKKMIVGFVKGLIGNKAPKNMCYVVGLPLQSFLSFQGIECELTEGEILYKGNKWHHWWITLSDGMIVDATARQFRHNGIAMPNLYGEPKPNYYRPYTKEEKANKALKDFGDNILWSGGINGI